MNELLNLRCSRPRERLAIAFGAWGLISAYRQPEPYETQMLGFLIVASDYSYSLHCSSFFGLPYRILKVIVG